MIKSGSYIDIFYAKTCATTKITLLKLFYITAVGNFPKWLLYKCFMSLSLIVIQTNIKFLKISVTWKSALITLEIHNYTHY